MSPTPMADPVIDTHVHLWDLRRTPRQASTFVRLLGWSPTTMRWLARRLFPRDTVEFFGPPDFVLADYLPDQYAEDTGAWEVEGFVHIEADWHAKGPMAPVEETRWLDGLGAPGLAAIVGRVDLSAGPVVSDVLAAHLAASTRLRGVRDPLAHHPASGVMNSCDKPGLLRDEQWRKGFAQLATHDLSFDATVYHHQLGDLATLAADIPEVPIVLDHAGTPPAAAGSFSGLGTDASTRERTIEQWQDAISRLADREQVTAKISGLAMPVLGWAYETRDTPPSAEEVTDDLGPFVTHLLDSFGADRCMFGSNFPVDKVSLPWTTLLDAIDRILADRTPQERAAVLADTARRVYRI